MLIARTRMRQLKQSQQLQQQSSSQRVGALSLIPSCLGISGHPSRSRQGHPRYTGARSAGRPWVARTQFSTADHSVRNTPNMVAEERRSRARALATRALLTRVCCDYGGPRDEEVDETIHENFDEKEKMKHEIKKSVKDGATSTKERTLTSSENKTSFETQSEIDEYFYSSVNVEMLTIAVRTHAGYAERVSMENLKRAISVEKFGL